MKTMMMTRAALSLALLLGGCGGESEEDASAPAPTSEKSSSSSSPTAPSAVPSTPPAPTVDLAAACEQFAAGWIGDVTKKAFMNDGALAQSLVDVGDQEVVSAFEPVATIAASAAKTIGTIDYIDDEEAYDGAVVRLNSACKQVGSPIFTG